MKTKVFPLLENNIQQLPNNLTDIDTRSHTALTDIGSHTHAQIDAALGYAVQIEKDSGTTPTDGVTYYTGINNSSTQGNYRVWIPAAGTITKIYGHFAQVAGSAENVVLSLLHNGVNNTIITNTLQLNAADVAFSKTDIAQAVAAGDYIELKWICPTWVTNPTGLIISATVWIAT